MHGLLLHSIPNDLVKFNNLHTIERVSINIDFLPILRLEDGSLNKRVCLSERFDGYILQGTSK